MQVLVPYGFLESVAPLVASDPNWFYSTLAQSTAAIVGLAGGFLAARLTTYRGEVADARLPLKQQFDGSVGQQLELAKGVISRARTQLLDFLREVDSTDAVKNATILPLSARLPTLSQQPAPSPGTAPLTEEQRAALGEFADTLERVHRIMESITTNSLAQLLWRGKPLRAPSEPWLDEEVVMPGTPQTYWEGVGSEREHAKLWYQNIRGQHGALIPKVQALRSRLLPWTFGVLLTDLTILLVVGTIVPMGFLSAHGATGKTLLLIAFSVLALGVSVILGYEMLQIRKAGDLSRDSF